MATKHISEDPTPPTEIEPAIPQELEGVILRLLSKSPADRHAGAHELHRELERMAEGGSQPQEPSPPPPPPPSGPPQRRGTFRWWRAVVVAGLICVVVGGGVAGAIVAGDSLWAGQGSVGEVSRIITPTLAPTVEPPAVAPSAEPPADIQPPGSGAGRGSPGNGALEGGPAPPTPPPSKPPGGATSRGGQYSPQGDQYR